MKKQSPQQEAKEAQGHTRRNPVCSNCVHFHLDTQTEVGRYGTWTREVGKRCELPATTGVGKPFATGKSDWCPRHEFKPLEQ